MSGSVRARLTTVFDNLSAHKYPLRYAVGVALLRTRLNRLFRIKHPDFTIRFQPTALSLALWADPAYQSVDHEFLRSYLRPGDSVVDVGANIGSLTLTAAAAVGPSGSVLSVEADPHIATFLVRNCHANCARHVRVVQCAVGSEEGVVSLCRQADDSATFVSLRSSHGTIPMRTLDGLVRSEPGRISLIKIDVEGYELRALAGAARTLERTDCVYFEVWRPLCARYGYEPRDLLTLLEAAGFRVYRFVSSRCIRPVVASFTAETLENLLAIRDVEAYCARTATVVAA